MVFSEHFGNNSFDVAQHIQQLATVTLQFGTARPPVEPSTNAHILFLFHCWHAEGLRMGEFLLHHMLQGAPAWDLLGSISSMVTVCPSDRSQEWVTDRQSLNACHSLCWANNFLRHSAHFGVLHCGRSCWDARLVLGDSSNSAVLYQWCSLKVTDPLALFSPVIG
jgi:hypothetical protein